MQLPVMKMREAFEINILTKTVLLKKTTQIFAGKMRRWEKEKMYLVS